MIVNVNRPNIKIILVEPSGEINLGSVARLCKNFGIQELRLVNPRCDVKSVETRKMALKGIDLIKDKIIFNDRLKSNFWNGMLRFGKRN